MTGDLENLKGFIKKGNPIRSLDLAQLHNFSLPFQFKEQMFGLIGQLKGIDFEKVVAFLESRSPPLAFEYEGYDRPGIELKTINRIKGIFLMINPDPRAFEVVPPESMVICHHKISVYDNDIFQNILSSSKENRINIYNYHLAWDIMVDGIADTFLYFLGYEKDEIEKKTLTYKGNKIPRLGSIIKKKVALSRIITMLHQLGVKPSVVVSPEAKNTTVGYIPGGGFIDQMMIDMAAAGVDVLISSDPLWVNEILARELKMTLISINHYDSERYGLDNMQSILSKQFYETPVIVLEETNNIRAKIEIIIQDLIDIASQDGYITEEENTIIVSANKMINNFMKEYNRAWEKKFITSDERAKLSRLWNMIYTETVKSASKDDLLSFEEMRLLEHLFDKIRDPN